LLASLEGFELVPDGGRGSDMDERRRLLALLEVYDTAIEELYVLGDRGFVDLILRLERRRIDAAARLARPDGEVSHEVAPETASIAASPTPL
jgi:hypothetical protein